MYSEHLRVPVGAGSLHVERVGRAGPPVVLLHGFGTCTFLWRAVAPRLAEAGYTVIAVDLMGHGESDRPADVSYELGAQAQYVEQALTALRLPEAAVVGQDIGGLVALLLAAQRPARTRKIALLEPPDPDDLPGPGIRVLQRTSVRSALAANTLFGARPLLEPLLRREVSQPARMPDRLIARYLAPFVGNDGAAQLLQLASAVALSDEERQRIGDVAADVLLWVGAERGDETVARLRGWRVALPNATVRPLTVQARGSLVAEVAPLAVISALQAWLA
ncbi:MAG: alpha/beta hydrolase [Gemmatimonadota bacterium]|jgi:pimeloyl-ACP methyl ester carboxylesterase|nr:alpha/beta hydrolase [Gemmatimonadota bacterium]MDQ8167596.1 alpha/beta hydrolase [Gemmatimonadota bacterium]MDQ8171713.1 alpha/beta hydrolase [Gemmatimonadota bacterium]